MSSWIIKAKVTDKTELKTFTNQRGDGSVFSIELLDSHGGEIKCSLYNDVATKWFPVIKVGKCYTISKGQIRVANKRFQKCDNDFSITFNNFTEVLEVTGEGSEIEEKEIT
jgi:replication factor A1